VRDRSASAFASNPLAQQFNPVRVWSLEPISAPQEMSQPAGMFPTLSWQIVGDLGAHPASPQVLAALDALRTGMGGDADLPGEDALQVIAFEAEADRTPIVLVRTGDCTAFTCVCDLFESLSLVDRLRHIGTSDGLDAAYA